MRRCKNELTEAEYYRILSKAMSSYHVQAKLLRHKYGQPDATDNVPRVCSLT